MVLITFMSLSTFPQGTGPELHIPNIDKAVHFIFYAVATLLGIFFIRERTRGRISFNRALLQLILIVIVYGILIEVFQWAFTLTRHGDLDDVLANSVGVITAGAFMKFLHYGKSRLKW